MIYFSACWSPIYVITMDASFWRSWFTDFFLFIGIMIKFDTIEFAWTRGLKDRN